MDNSFRTAKLLGSIGSRNSQTLRARGAISRRDRTDIYRVLFSPSAPFTVRSSSQIRGGTLEISLYVQTPNGIQQLSRERARPTRRPSSFSLPIPAIPVNTTFYVRFDRPMANRPLGNVRYSLTARAL